MILTCLLSLALLAQPAEPAPNPADPPASAPPQPAPDPDRDATAAQLLARWNADLEALDPASPAAYFQLAERIADRHRSPGEIDLARTLFVLAFELDRRAPRPEGWASAACLALADLEPLARDRRWLLALAADADPAPGRAHFREPPPPPLEPAYLAATAVGMVRSGEGRAALRLLERPEVRRLLASYERLLSPMGYAGGLDQLLEEAQRWPCETCRNQRVIRTAQPGGRVDVKLCPACKGDPGPTLTPERFAAQLRLEARLLRGIHRSWAAQVIADAGVPLRDLDPEELAAVYRVDPAAVHFRNGAWTTDPARP